MNLEAIQKLVIEKSISIDIEAGITLQIKNEAFRPGTVRVHLPAPINASWLKEGQLLDSEPMFRMASVEDYPQRSVYYNERLTENTPFSVKYAFTSTHTYIKPDINLIDSTQQKEFSTEEIERFSKNHHCGCESYTALPQDAVSILDVIEDRGITFNEDYNLYIDQIMRSFPVCGTATLEKKIKNGTIAYAIYRFIIENFTKMERTDHNIAFVAMCRMCGIPARWQGGWATSSPVSPLMPNSSTNIYDGEIKAHDSKLNAIKHDWAIVHLLPYGWIYVDCSFGAEAFTRKQILEITNRAADTLSLENNTAQIELSDYFFGNIDPYMVPTASAPGADLYPAKDYERADKMFNVYGEVELVPDKLGAEGHFEGYGLSLKDYESTVSLAIIS